MGGPDGNDNADELRESKGSAFAPPSGNNAGGPIIISLAQDLSGSQCAVCTNGICQGTELGMSDPANTALCFGDGNYCGLTDDVVVFIGYAYDPAASFSPNESSELDGQFYAIAETGSNAGQGQVLSGTAPAIATNQIGHVVPEPGNWSTVGGQFILWRCFLSAGVDGGLPAVDLQVGGGLVPAHYAKTTSGPGNTFCATWTLDN
jgi:hypothetical protein